MQAGRVTALALVLILLGGSGASVTRGAASAAPRYEVTHRRKLAQGLWVKWIRDNRGPNRIKVLTLDPTGPLTLDVVLANGKLPGRETTSSMARRHGAVAAINGTFGLPWGRPIGVFVEDTFIKASPLVWGNGFALSQDEQTPYIGHPQTRVRMSSTGQPDSVVWAWNEPGLPPSPLLGYTPEGGQRARPPGNACSARLEDQGLASWAPNNDGVQREYIVHKVMCSAERMRRAGRTVISAPDGSKLTERITNLQEGQPVRLTWSVGWPGAVDAIAGNPVLVADGENVAYKCPVWFCLRNPRTGIGVREDGRVLLVTVDGRRKGSVGMTLLAMARLFRYLGATDALNLDGGGSTTMVVNDHVINKPSDPAGERDVSSSIVIVPGEDEGEPALLPYVDDPSTGGRVANPSPGTHLPSDRSFDRALTDPGSTGGLIDSLKRRRGGNSLPATLLRLAKRYELGGRR